MPWLPRYTAEFEGRLIDNILTLVTRDMKLALDYFYPADALPDFAERCLSYPIGLNFPTLVIDPVSNPVDESEDESHLNEVAQFVLVMGITDSDAELVTRKCMKYVRALDAVLRTGTPTDYFAGYTMSKVGGLQIDVAHEFGDLGENQTKGLYFRPATLGLILRYLEI